MSSQNTHTHADAAVQEPYFEARVHSVQEAITRARTAFLIVNLATVIVLAGLYNGYFSWMRHLVTRTPAPGYEDVSKAISASRVNDTAVIWMPAIGVKFFVSDLGIVAGFAMLVLAYWLYYSVRREQRSVGMLVVHVAGHAHSPAEDVPNRVISRRFSEAKFALFALSSRFVFMTLRSDAPMGIRIEQNFRPFLNWAVRLLIYAPCWTVALCGIVDLVSLWKPSALLPAAANTAKGQMPSLMDQLAEPQVLEAFGRIAVTALLSVFIGALVSRADRFYGWTHDAYVRLHEEVAAEEGRRLGDEPSERES